MSKKIETKPELKAVGLDLTGCYKVAKLIEKLETGELTKMTEVYSTMFEATKLMTAGVFDPEKHTLTTSQFKTLTTDFLALSQEL